MKFHYIELNKYKRMRLNDFDHFAMTITSPLQLILGTNGSGKSSLLSELSPLPANKDDFEKGGSKIIKFEHLGVNYTLSSDFSKSQPHSFLINDTEEKNPGGTITVQRELVKHYFGITQAIQDLLLGKIEFTNMSTSSRKEWTLLLCDAKFDYAIQVYNKLKEQLRDTIGAIKIARRNIVVESEKLLQDEEIEKLHETSRGLHECLSILLERRIPAEYDSEQIERKQEQFSQRLMDLSTTLKTLIGDPLEASLKVEDCEAEILKYTQETAALEAVLNTLVTRHSEIQKKAKVLESVENSNVDSLEEENRQLTLRISEMNSSRFVNFSIENPNEAIRNFVAIRDSLLEILSTIPENHDKKYSQVLLNQAYERRVLLQEVKNKQISELAKSESSLKHLLEHRDHPDVSCPNCNHKFSLNYTEDKESILVQKIDRLRIEIDEVTNPEIIKNDTYIDECTLYGTLYRQFVTLLNSQVQLRPYSEYLSEKKIINEKPRLGVHELTKIQLDLELLSEIFVLETKRKKNQEFIDALKSIDEKDLHSLHEQAEDLNEQISKKTTEVIRSREAQIKYTKHLKRLTDIDSLRNQIIQILRQKKDLFKTDIETLRRNVFNRMIRDIQSRLASVEHDLNGATHQREKVRTLTSQIEELSKNNEALELLMQQLSPSEGLIAEGLLGFINNFVDQMNHLISKIWSYPLMVQNCKVENDETVELDYKFPVLIGDDQNSIKDVSDGSTGIMEILNLAYRLTAMQYLGLSDYPIYLDEIAHSFDNEHKLAVVQLVKDLVEQHAFPQVFLISHDYLQYSSLKNNEYCVLNPANILVPNRYNQHVVTK